MGCITPNFTKITYLLLLFPGVFSLAELGSAEQPNASAVQGKWWILGNVSRGTLEITIGAGAHTPLNKVAQKILTKIKP